MDWLKLRPFYDSLPQTENYDEKTHFVGNWWPRNMRWARSTVILVFTNTITILALIYSVTHQRTSELSWKDISTTCENWTGWL